MTRCDVGLEAEQHSAAPHPRSHPKNQDPVSPLLIVSEMFAPRLYRVLGKSAAHAVGAFLASREISAVLASRKVCSRKKKFETKRCEIQRGTKPRDLRSDEISDVMTFGDEEAC